MYFGNCVLNVGNLRHCTVQGVGSLVKSMYVQDTSKRGEGCKYTVGIQYLVSGGCLYTGKGDHFSELMGYFEFYVVIVFKRVVERLTSGVECFLLVLMVVVNDNLQQ